MNDDLISRQAAIDKMMDLYNEDVELYGVPIPEGFDGHRAVEAIKEIPPAEPAEIIRCKDCKWWDKSGARRTMGTSRERTAVRTVAAKNTGTKRWRRIRMHERIPVNKELPVGGLMVLVTCKTKKGQRSVNRAYYMDGCWHGSGSMSGVTAWMPMPIPFEEGKE